VDAQARDRIRQALHARGLGASDAVVEAFLQRVGTDARTIASEADKLAAYLGDRAVVRPEDIRAVTSPGREAAAWDLADAMGGKDLAGTLAELRMLLDQREAPLGLMALLASRFRDLALYREALDKGWLTLRPGARGGQTAEWKCLPPALENACESGVVADPRRVHPYRATCLAVQASLYTAAELARIQGIIVETYERLLSGSVPDALAMELLVLRAMGRG
jgi:DNA polymerase III delta subunit